MSDILAIGNYREGDAKALRDEFAALEIETLDDLARLDENARAGIRGAAFKGNGAFDGAAMDLLPGLKMIANFGVGFDAIDVDAATARGIVVTNTPDVLNDDVADLAVGLWLAQARGFEAGAAQIRAGRWASEGPLPLARKASGRRVGILGMGRIGREIADRLAAFKCEIHYHARGEKDTPGWTFHADPVAMARAVDDVIIAIVGGAATENYVGEAFLRALGPDGVIVNISRGSVIDEEALIAALENGTIRGAGLDVFRGEPDVDERLRAMENVYPLPHLGSATIETRAEMAALQRRNLAALRAGEAPLTPVNAPG
ncbi:MAG: 2-hydroxyacid dehydrogenase [Paracoccus sp. (in: a-proteobacteria)]|nr:2-hydroxyacid dehydrogenase [Paracoccus sp. (in: a-proteobacteria)]